MCRRGHIYVTKNGHKVIANTDRSAIVLQGSKEFPTGMLIPFMSSMGHVLCVGSDDHRRQNECKLHPMDLHNLIDYLSSSRSADAIIASIPITSHLTPHTDAAVAATKQHEEAEVVIETLLAASH
jgi:hypothetical protein